MKPEVLLIDLSNLFWTAWHATAEQGMTGAHANTQAAIRRAVGDSGRLVAICCDEGRSWRKAIAPEYKANRPEKDKSALGELSRLKDKLRADGYLLWGVDGYEADDVIATAAKLASDAGHPVCIASADKDLLQLLELPDSSCLRTFGDWPVMRAADVVTKLGIEPAGVRDYLALTGDKSDNIEGARGVGPVTAKELLIAHGDLDALYGRIGDLVIESGDPENPTVILPTKTIDARKIATPAVLQSLWDNRAKVMLARDLVTLKFDAPIKFEEIYERRKPVTKTEGMRMEDDQDEPEDSISSGPGPAAVPDPKEPPASLPETLPPAASAPIQSDAGTTAGMTMMTNSGPTPATETRALAVSVTYERALEPRSPDGAMRIAEALFESRAFTRFPTSQAIFAALVGGRELGFGAIASVNAFHFMSEMGCLALKAHTIGELAMRNPKCKYLRLISSDETEAVYEGWHVDHPAPYTHRYTIQDAVDAGLATLQMVPRTAAFPTKEGEKEKPGEKDKRGQWDKRRKQMIRKTCLTQIVTILWPGSGLGFNSVEDLSEGRDE